MQEPPTPQARGEGTRDALIRAGIELFGELGYDAATSRALAATASVNQALIGYHFGSKRGLYLAVFEHVAARFSARTQPVRERVEALLEPSEPGDRRDLLEALFELIDGLVDLFASPETEGWAALVVREQQHPTEAFEVLWERMIAPVSGVLARLVAALRDEPATAPDVRLLVVTIIGQALVLRVSRASVERILGWQTIGPDEVAAIKGRLHANILSLLSPEESR